MSGGSYVALSGMHTRLEQLDRLSTDIANASTPGYKMTRTSNSVSSRPQFDKVLESAIDVTTGGRRLDVSAGSVNPTGRDLDVALEGWGFFVVETPAGTRYTRNGHFVRSPEGLLATEGGGIVQGTDGPIEFGPGKVVFKEDGTLRVGATVAGTLAVVNFADPGKLVSEGSMLRADGLAQQEVGPIAIRGGALEESNVTVVVRIAELTDVMRGFEALQKAITIEGQSDSKAMDILGRR